MKCSQIDRMSDELADVQQSVEIARLNHVLKEYGITDKEKRKSICGDYFLSQAEYFDQGSCTHKGRRYRAEMGLSEGKWKGPRLKTREQAHLLPTDSTLHEGTLGTVEYFFEQEQEKLTDIEVFPPIEPVKEIADFWDVSICFCSGETCGYRIPTDPLPPNHRIEDGLRRAALYAAFPNCLQAAVESVRPNTDLNEVSPMIAPVSRIVCRHKYDWQLVDTRGLQGDALREAVGTPETLRGLTRTCLGLIQGRLQNNLDTGTQGEDWDLIPMDQGPCLKVNRHWTQELEELTARLGISSFNLDHVEDMAFFQAYAPQVKHLLITPDVVIDVDTAHVIPSSATLAALSAMASLEALTINWCRTIDFNRFGQLRRLSITGSDKRATSLEALSSLTALEELTLCNDRLESLAGIEALVSLRELSLSATGWSGIQGIESAQHLESVTLAFMPELVDLQALAKLTGLRQLKLLGCPNVTDLTPLSGLKHLRQLSLDGCKAINSIRALSELYDLRAFSLGKCGAVIDGDLDVLTRLPRLQWVKFTEKKHYSHKQRQIVSAIKARGGKPAASLDEVTWE